MGPDELSKIEQDLAQLLQSIEKDPPADGWGEFLKRYKSIQAPLLKFDAEKVVPAKAAAIRDILERIDSLNHQLDEVTRPHYDRIQKELNELQKGLKGTHAYHKNMD